MKLEHLALVGLGSIGRRHLRLIRELRPDLEITLVRSGKGQSWPEEKLAHSSVSSIPEAIQSGIQAAIISSPSPFHTQQSLQLAQAGVHQLIEKPLSHETKGLVELEESLLQHNVKVLIGYVLRHDPAARCFKKELDQGRVGTLLHVKIECGSYLPDWRHEQDYRQTASAKRELGGGVLLELSHELDYVRWFFGTVSNVQALLINSGSLDIEVEDCAELTLENEAGLPVQVHLDFHRRHPIRTCKIQGTEGELCWDAISQEISFKSIGGEFESRSFLIARDKLFSMQLCHFLDCLEEGCPPVVSFEDGVAAVRLVEAARNSHKTGQRINL